MRRTPLFLQPLFGRSIFGTRARAAGTGGFDYPDLRSDNQERLVALEAVRGVAAVVVAVHHCLLGFAPHVSGLVDAAPWALFGTPVFALVNGSFAVVVFFVLSGFVLSVRPLRRQSSREVAEMALRRWPRLALPVLIVNVAAALLFLSGAYFNQLAAPVSGSSWLSGFYRAGPGTPSLGAAALEGGFGTFFLGTGRYNSSLWTMYFEFYGSMLVFLLTYAASRSTHRVWLAIGSAWLLATWINPYFGCFVVGLALAKLLPAIVSYTVSRTALAVLVSLAVVLAGYHEPLGRNLDYGWYSLLAPGAVHYPLLMRVLLHTLGATIIIVLALQYSTAPFLNSRWGANFGRLSFSLYLLHVPIICSVGSLFYVKAAGLGAAGSAACAIVGSLAISFALSLPLARVDERWRWFLAHTVRLPGPHRTRRVQLESRA